MQGFFITGDKVEPLATRKDTWVKIFGVMNYVAIIWGLIIMAKRVNFFKVSIMAKTGAFIFASSLIFFYLGLNLYKAYAFKTYGAKKSHNHSHTKSKGFASAELKYATLLQTGENRQNGAICNMDLINSYKTNHAALSNGKIKQYCSLHCLAEDLYVKKSKLENIQVVDVESLKFIDAKSAFYVIGSRQKGTMSNISKYAFAKKESAQEFIKKYGGKISTFDEALNLAKAEF